LSPAPQSLLILAFGNPLCGDDGLGVAALDLLGQKYRLPGGVVAMDAGTLGLSLLHYIKTADALILVDAVRNGDSPGTFVRLEGDDLTTSIEERRPVHRGTLAEIFDGLRWTLYAPHQIVLLGLAPKTRELGGRTSKEVARALDKLAEAIAEETARLGLPLIPRDPDDAVRGRAPVFVPRAARA
jgi:hydrogenase maturation protease